MSNRVHPAQHYGGAVLPGSSQAVFRRKDRQHAPGLIVSASAGTGHVSAGRALETAFRDDGWSDILHVDILDLTPRWVRAAYGGGFELLASRAPAVWREVYRRSNGPDADDARWATMAQRTVFRDFDRLLRSRRWAFCVATHFLPCQLAAGRGGPPFTAVVTDFTLHRYWVQPRVHHYCVATPEMATDLRHRLPAASITVSGIPVAAGFRRGFQQYRARMDAGLPADRPIALVMGGGLGIGVEDSARAALESGVPDLQVVAVCGRNDTARGRLTALAEGAEHLRVIGYTSDVATLIAASDVVVTKPGGLTCSETLALGRPLVLTRAIPGHEEANVQYLCARGAAIDAPSTRDVGAALRNLLLDPTVLAAYTARALDTGMRNAARSVVDSVTSRIARRDAA
jgi:processive 1,2-diacylglycerol beta-glucosyltransferase